MDQNLFSLRTHFLWKSVRAFFLFFLLLIGFNAWGQYTGNFNNSTGGTSSYAANKTITLNSRDWLASYVYHSGGEFRLGRNNDAFVASKFFPTSTSGSSIEMQWDMANVKTFSITSTKSYGTINRWYIFESVNGGTTWTQVLVANYSASTLTYTATTPKASARYAIVITSAQANQDPRAVLTDIDITVEAPASYTLTYNGNSNTLGAVPAQQTGASSYTVSGNTGNLTRTGFTWAGWTMNSAGSGTVYGPSPYTTSTGTLTSATNLFARWAYTVTYNANGTGVSGLPATQTGYNSQSTTVSSTAPTRTGGYTFTGWNTSADGSGTNYNPNANYIPGSVGNIVLYAQWSAPVNYNLTYNGNGSTSGTVPPMQTGASSYTVVDNTGNLDRVGYFWTGWTTSNVGTGTAYGSAYTASTGTLTADTTLYARWSYYVIYQGNGNTGGTVPTTQSNYNSISTTLSGAGTMVRAGYTFGGWKYASGDGGTVDFPLGSTTYTPVTGSATRTLYAHWIKNPSKLTVTPTSLSGFTYAESNGPSSVQSFVLTGSDLENTDTDPVELITIDNNFEIAEAAAGPYSHAIELPATYVGASKTFYVRLKAGLQVNANYTDTVLVSGGNALEANYAEVALSGSVTACLAPTTQSAVSSFSAVGINGMTVNFTSGNGIGRVVVMNTSNSFTNPLSSTTLPTDNTVYAGSGEQVIYAGAGNSVVVTGLSPSTTYWYRVYEYKICSGNYTYATTTPTNNPRSQITACDTPLNPNGDIELDNPYCGSADLVYELGSNDFANLAKGVTYYWQIAANGTSTANPLVFAPDAAASNPYNVTVSRIYYVRAYNNYCWSTTSYTTGTAVTFISAIGISSQPANQNTVVGATGTFTVTASNASSYQWQVSTNGGTTWTNVANATSASYTTAATTLAMNGYRYRVRLGNSCGTLTSNVAVLSVVTGPCLSEDFNGTTTPSGWLATNVSWTEYSAGGSFNANNGTLTTPQLVRPSRLTFDLIRTNNATAKTLLVKVSTTGQNTGFNTTIATYTHSNTTSNGTTSIDLDLSDYSTEDQVWIRLEKSSSTTSPWRFDNVEVFCAPACTPATITAFPISGPAGTIVTITGTNFTSGSTVKFGTATAVVEYINATQLRATVPATADGNIIVDTTLECDSEVAFNLIKQDASGCETLANGTGSGNPFASDLIFYEVYDENGGSGGTITIYNGTSAAVNLSNYSFYRTGTIGGTYAVYGALTGIVASGELAVIGISGNCSNAPTATHGTINGGFNDNDGFQLRKNSGAIIVDEVLSPSYAGYYLKRKPTSLSPKSTYDASDWTETSVASNECLSNVGVETPAVKTSPPVITSQPNYAVSCDVVNTSLTLTATEGYVGGNALAYQWYELKNTGAWTAVMDGGIYSGATTQILTISDVDGLNNYQYYCQVRENTQTCYTATNATQIKATTNTWAANVWSNGTPVLSSKVIIAGNYDTQVNGVLDVCDLTINAGGTMRVKPNFPVTVKKKIINNNPAANSFVIENDANLIQTENVANEGDVKVERSVVGLTNTATNGIDYVYWSSPVIGQTIKGTTGFSPGTPNTGFQQYRESDDRFVTTNDPVFVTGKGYAIRAENGLADGYDKTYTFTGIANNGNLSTPALGVSSGTDKGYNLIGNPYPSNIDFDQFHALNSTKIYATAFFWTNNTYTPQQMGSGYTGNNYAIYNITGGVPATYDDGNPNYSTAPNGKIKVGQAFIVQSKIAGALDFNNTIRVTDPGTFYQKGNVKNRFWLTMKSPKNMINTILVGYLSGATNGYEKDFDGELFAVGSDSFYSVLGAKKLAIQGKAKDLVTEDVVSLGAVFSVNGDYTVKLQNVEGDFDGNQSIYLRDKLLNKYINLSIDKAYTFQATKGTDNTRFEIVYKDGTLGTVENNKSEFLVYKQGQDFVIRSSNKLGKVELFDVSGRLVTSFTTNQTTAKIDMSTFTNGIFIIKAENSGEIRTKKISK